MYTNIQMGSNTQRRPAQNEHFESVRTLKLTQALLEESWSSTAERMRLQMANGKVHHSRTPVLHPYGVPAPLRRASLYCSLGDIVRYTQAAAGGVTQ